MCEVSTILRHCGPSGAGLAALYLIDTKDIVSIPLPNDDWVITDDIIIHPFRYWKQIFFREQKAGLADEMADAIGAGFKKTVGLFIPHYGNRSNKWVFNMIGTRFIMLVQDISNQVILVGNLAAPMRMEKAAGGTGEKLGDENGWAVNLIAESNRPCYLYEGSIIIESNIPPVKITNAIMANDTDYMDSGTVDPLLYN